MVLTNVMGRGTLIKSCFRVAMVAWLIGCSLDDVRPCSLKLMMNRWIDILSENGIQNPHMFQALVNLKTRATRSVLTPIFLVNLIPESLLG